MGLLNHVHTFTYSALDENDYKIKGHFNMRFQKNPFHHFSNMENSLTLLTQLILNEYFYMKMHDPHNAILKLHL